MDRYQRVEKPRPEEPINENEIRITAQGLIRNYISYSTSLLQEKRAKEIVLKAMGQAISKTVAIAEIIKTRIPGLYQDTSISSTSITDAYEPIEEGLQPLEMTRQVSLITITLSTTELNKNSPGYQAPSHVEQPQAENQQQQQQPRQALVSSTDVNQDPYGGRGRGQGRFRGRGRGRGRGRVGGQGRGRGGYGGYGNYQGENGGYHNYGREDDGYYNYGREDDGYYNYGRGGGRGRGWGYRGMGYERGRGGGRGLVGYERGRGEGGGRDLVGYERGRGGGGRGYGRGQGRVGGRGRGGRMGGRGRGGGNEA